VPEATITRKPNAALKRYSTLSRPTYNVIRVARTGRYIIKSKLTELSGAARVTDFSPSPIRNIDRDSKVRQRTTVENESSNWGVSSAFQRKI
jgi:hypothetical protein